MLFLRALWNRSALFASPLETPGVLALDAKPMVVIMIIAVPWISKLETNLVDIAADALPSGDVHPVGRFSEIRPPVIWCVLAQPAILFNVRAMVVPTTRHPRLDALLLGCWQMAGTVASVLQHGCVPVPTKDAPTTGISRNVPGMSLLMLWQGWLTPSRFMFALRVRRGIVLAKKRNVATTLGFHVVYDPMFFQLACAIVVSALSVSVKAVALVPLPSVRELFILAMPDTFACRVFVVNSISLLFPVRGSSSFHASHSWNVYAAFPLTLSRISLDHACPVHEHC